MNKIFLISCLLSQMAFAGGVETQPLDPLLLDSHVQALSQTAPSFYPPSLYLRHRDVLIESRPMLPMMDLMIDDKSLATLDGGVETRTMLSMSLSSGFNKRMQIELEKIKYAGEIDDSVVVMVNDQEMPVVVKGQELLKSPEFEAAVIRSLETSEWAEVQ